jgi:hypothetical protein
MDINPIFFYIAPVRGRVFFHSGLESEAINRHYTHVEAFTKRTALKKLPKLL